MKEKPRSTALDIISVYKKRFHLLKICAIPLILIFIAIYLLISPKDIYYSQSDIREMNYGIIIGLMGILSLIIIIIFSAFKTFREWNIAKKQKAYLKEQKHPHFNITLFIAILILIFVRFYFSGAEALMQVARFIDLIIIIAVIWSLYKFIKKKIA